MKNIVLVGVGGIGSCLIPSLPRYLNYTFPGSCLNLVDFDTFGTENLPRQAVGKVGQNKAEDVARQIRESNNFRNLTVVPYQVLLDEETAIDLLTEGSIILLAVDNHETRCIVSDYVEQNLQDAIVISGGNSKTTGTIQLYLRKGGKDLTLPLANKYHPEIRAAKDSRRRPQHHCDRRAAAGEPQVLSTNNLVAANMLVALANLLEGKEIAWNEQYVDALTGNTRTVFRR